MYSKTGMDKYVGLHIERLLFFVHFEYKLEHVHIIFIAAPCILIYRVSQEECARLRESVP